MQMDAIVLYEDHRNDLFINGFGIFSSAAGAKIAWWIDPTGAIIIAVCVMFSWGKTIYGEFNNLLVSDILQIPKHVRHTEQFTFLAGIAAPVDFQQLVIYKV
ncbi:hypothetical protein QFC22_005389 [Naganishia vaughanmartiniae]|uniref:Uncharacterized protein n=1 Tax=Naganishia vaughanmartiniae TaxID=1424756 RepID=A0ACC2WW58_9TREE|nr:hypothetical protein QFC22_005389 [Naganishia vaughanmartiniae]